VTADFVYPRFHGRTRLCGSSYDDAALRVWGERIRGWRDADLEVFATSPMTNVRTRRGTRCGCVSSSGEQAGTIPALC